MKFEYDEYCGSTEMVLSKEEIKLIKSKAKELRKICYGFGFFRFNVMAHCIGHDKDEDKMVEFTYEQVADSLREVLPFVETYKKKLVEDEFIVDLLDTIEDQIYNVSVSVLDSPLSVEDICTEMNDTFDCYDVAYAFSKFCGGRATVCKVYDYLKKQELEEDEDDEFDEDDED